MWTETWKWADMVPFSTKLPCQGVLSQQETKPGHMYYPQQKLVFPWTTQHTLLVPLN